MQLQKTTTGTYSGYRYTFKCTKETKYAEATIDWETTSSFTPWTGLSGTYYNGNGQMFSYEVTGGFSARYSLGNAAGYINSVIASGFLNGVQVATLQL